MGTEMNETDTLTVAPPGPPADAVLWTCPLTGECVSFDSIDDLADALERTQNAIRDLQATAYRYRERLAQLDATDDPDVVTRRLQGARRKVKLELPAVSWDQSKLRHIVAAHAPALVEPVVKVAEYRVHMPEWNKLVNTTGTPEFMTFKEALTQACRGRIGLPKITIET